MTFEYLNILNIIKNKCAGLFVGKYIFFPVVFAGACQYYNSW